MYSLKQAHSHYIGIVKYVKGKTMKFRRKIFKEEAPTNSVGSGAIAGVGVGPDGEPGVRKTKYKRKNEQDTPVLQNMIRRKLQQPMTQIKEGVFAGNKTFIIPSALFNEVRLAKSRGSHWDKYFKLNENDHVKAIREYANKNAKSPVIVQCENTGYICYARYGSN
jgi:hypothetical protein